MSFRGPATVVATILLIAGATTVSFYPAHRAEALAVLSGVYGLVVAIIVFLDDKHGLGKYPDVTLILSFSAFFHLVASVLAQ